jgi:RecB family exonuclease
MYRDNFPRRVEIKKRINLFIRLAKQYADERYEDPDDYYDAVGNAYDSIFMEPEYSELTEEEKKWIIHIFVRLKARFWGGDYFYCFLSTLKDKVENYW